MTGLESVTLANQYFLKKLAGQGAMAQVYQAWDPQRQTMMAIKVIRDPRFFETFRTEVVALKTLEHPNIVRLYDVGKDEAHGIIYLVMDWVDGQDLKTQLDLRKTPLEPAEVSRILDDLHKALNYAHTKGLCHCDIKPANVLMKRSDGQAILSDFGLAQAARQQGRGGTLAFMAPELFQGGHATAASDIYALGVTLYMLLSCRLPFEFANAEQLAVAHITQHPAPLRNHNPAVPQGMNAVIEKALSKDPARRQTSVTELWMEFSRFANARGSGPPDPVRRQAISQPGPARTAILVGVRGENAGSRVRIPGQGMTVGRGSASQLHLTDPSVSRHHAEIRCRAGAFYLADCRSTVGTFFNNLRVGGEEQRLREGDRIRFGASDVFEFHET